MSMTVSSETMHENHNQDAAYDSVDIPLSLSSVDMAAVNTEKNWSQPILEEDPHFSDLHIFHAHVVPRKKDVHLQAQDLQVHIYTHTNAWHLFTPWMITDAHNTYAVTESEKTHVADWTCSFPGPVHLHNETHIQKGHMWLVEPVHFTPFTHIQKHIQKPEIQWNLNPLQCKVDALTNKMVCPPWERWGRCCLSYIKGLSKYCLLSDFTPLSITWTWNLPQPLNLKLNLLN